MHLVLQVSHNSRVRDHWVSGRLKLFPRCKKLASTFARTRQTFSIYNRTSSMDTQCPTLPPGVVFPFMCVYEYIHRRLNRYLKPILNSELRTKQENICRCTDHLGKAALRARSEGLSKPSLMNLVFV